MYSSRIRTIRCSGHLSCHACPPPPHMPPLHHACPPLPCMPPSSCMPPCGQTDACENITFPKLLLRTVKKSSCFHHVPLYMSFPCANPTLAGNDNVGIFVQLLMEITFKHLTA